MISINLKTGDVESENEIIVGIDLGTTNSLVAYIKDGSPFAIKDKSGKNALTPSVVHFDADQKVIVGDAAKEKLISDPNNTIYSVKRLMGKSYKDVKNQDNFFGYDIIDEDTDSLVKIRVKNKFYTPIELSSQILSELKSRAELELGQPVHKAVITVPAYFNDAQRQATRDAGKLAGLDVLRIVNEPTAASLAYGINLLEGDTQTIAVYDLGGGTFDISILQIQDGVFEVLSTNGDTFLGGDDFDSAIFNFFIEKNNIEKAFLRKNQSIAQALRLEAEKAKKALSFEENYNGQIADYQCNITKSEFENLIFPLVKKTIDCCKN
jgi:molecular chaperone HscA